MRPALDDARRKHLADHLIAYAVTEAERAVLELDALMIDPRRRRGVRRDLAGRLMTMVDEWFEAATQKGQGECPGVAAAAKAAERSFRARVRELRAAAAPGGHA